ncbi:ABC transporter permease [Micromonospora sp. NPDC005087]|uniref:ABC transporter permease n=1 Tax=Micromonospora sp. NPDC005087 TaxID=3364225 RepID=UPI0036AE2CC7
MPDTGVTTRPTPLDHDPSAAIPEPAVPPAAATGGWRRRLSSRQSQLWTALVLLVVLAGIQITSLFMPEYVFPDLPAIGQALMEILRDERGDITATVLRFTGALLGAMVAGWAIGLLMGAFRNTVGELLRPVFGIMQAVPALSWILVSVIWLHSVEARIFFIVFVIGVPFFVVAVFEGIRNIDHELMEGIGQFRPSRLQILRVLFVPQSLTYMLMTLRSAGAFCLRILVFAELIGATAGVGYSMGLAQANFRIDLIFAWTVVLVVFNFLLTAVVDLAERHLLKWRREAVVR